MVSYLVCSAWFAVLVSDVPCLVASDEGDLETALTPGLADGVSTCGILVEIIERYWASNLALLITMLFGLVVGAPSS